MTNVILATILSLMTIVILLKILKWTKILMEDLSEGIEKEKAVDGLISFKTYHD